MRHAWPAGVLLLALATAIRVAWPVLGRPTSAFPCSWRHPDCLANQWLILWVARQVQAGQSLLHNDRYYWPFGDHPWIAGSGSDGLLLAPWDAFFGWPLGLNLYETLILALNGVSAYVMVRALGVSRPGALAAVPTAAAMAYAVVELSAGRFSQVSYCWLAFFVAAWVRFLDAPRAGTTALAAGMYALTCFFYWFYGVFAAMLGVILWLSRPTGWRPLAGFLGLVLVLLGPFLGWTLAHRELVPGIEEAFPHAESLASARWPAIPFRAYTGELGGRALPLSTAVLALGALVWRRDRWTWALVAVWAWFAALMAGPLWPGGPYELVYGAAEPLRRFWWPIRHVVVLNLVTIALAARAADRWLATRPLLGWLLALSIPVQLAVQGVPAHAVYTVATPSGFYPGLRAHPATVLIEPPLAPEVASSEALLYFQLLHGKALIGGHALWVARVRPPRWDAYMDANSFLAELRRLERGELDGRFRYEARDLRALVDAGASLLVVNADLFPVRLQPLARAYRAVCRELFGEPIAEDGRAWAWDLRPEGRTEARFTGWTWPEGVAAGGPSQPIALPPMPSSTLAVGVPEVLPR